jgi:hypothetical protein
LDHKDDSLNKYKQTLLGNIAELELKEDEGFKL